MSAGAVIAIRRRRLVRRFREVGAINRDHAVTVESLGERRSWIFEQMVRHRVFCATGEGRFYLNEQAAATFLHERRVRAWTISAVLLLLFVLLWVAGLLAR